MIKNFDNFVKESREFKPHRAYGIGGYKFKVYNKEDYEGNDDTIEVHQRHPNMGMLKWFTIDKNSIFHTDTSATEEFVLGKMIEILEPSLPNNQVKYKEDNKKLLTQFIDTYPKFKKWFERAKRDIKYGI